MAKTLFVVFSIATVNSNEMKFSSRNVRAKMIDELKHSIMIFHWDFKIDEVLLKIHILEKSCFHEHRFTDKMCI